MKRNADANSKIEGERLEEGMAADGFRAWRLPVGASEPPVGNDGGVKSDSGVAAGEVGSGTEETAQNGISKS